MGDKEKSMSYFKYKGVTYKSFPDWFNESNNYDKVCDKCGDTWGEHRNGDCKCLTPLEKKKSVFAFKWQKFIPKNKRNSFYNDLSKLK